MMRGGVLWLMCFICRRRANGESLRGRCVYTPPADRRRCCGGFARAAAFLSEGRGMIRRSEYRFTAVFVRFKGCTEAAFFLASGGRLCGAGGRFFVGYRACGLQAGRAPKRRASRFVFLRRTADAAASYHGTGNPKVFATKEQAYGCNANRGRL